ncbi:hypothetical protein [uncultured Aquimarina sp.]|uniref:hypothetical protein n=1 Tax=uncultured Aquimarina sp. TaxID=575652 RepID=UPI0026333E12|nr:hypothetical protein [uncultured Aquimarina sp.]
MNKYFYIISEHPTKKLDEQLESIFIHIEKTEKRNIRDSLIGIESDNQISFEIAICSDFDVAETIYQQLIKPIGINEKNSNYWFYSILNKRGLLDFISLRKYQLFSLKEFKNYEKKLINLNQYDFEYQYKQVNGVILKGKKSSFENAFVFWLNAVSKVQVDDCDFSTDLDGGTYNPINLENLKMKMKESCGNLSDYIDFDRFVSAIEVNNNSKDGCFFVELKNEYLLMDIFCP